MEGRRDSQEGVGRDCYVTAFWPILYAIYTVSSLDFTEVKI